MDVFQIEGPTRLSGKVTVSGAKNAALPILASTLLAEGPIHLEHVPQVTDVVHLAQLLASLGMRVGQLANGLLRIETIDSAPFAAPEKIARQMRASFCVLGPLLAKRGRAVVPLPGGCNLGERPVDLHLRGLAALGAEISLKEGHVHAQAKRLRGATINLLGPRGSTVTGTANVMSAAVLAEGKTVIEGAATEPEVVDLGNFLQQMGADLVGLGTETLTIRGVRRLQGTSYRIIPDRIEAATFLIAGAITRSRILVQGMVPEHLRSLLDLLERFGVLLDRHPNQVALDARDHLLGPNLEIRTGPYPALPTDVQSLLASLCSIAPGHQSIRDTVFPDRFAHIAELNRLGAMIQTTRQGAQFDGASQLLGSKISSGDLRAGAGLCLASLAAEGSTLLHGIHHLDRGYERFEEKLRQLGAKIERIPQQAKIPAGFALSGLPLRQKNLGGS